MNKISRRDLCFTLPAVSLFPILSGVVAAQTPTASMPAANAPIGNSLNTDLTQCTAFPLQEMPLRYSGGGAPTHDIARGTVPTGERIELHETTVEPGKMPHPEHKHPHEEFILVREGTMDFIFDGKSHILSPGSVGYTAPNQVHGFKNVGSTPATYFIFSLSKM